MGKNPVLRWIISIGIVLCAFSLIILVGYVRDQWEIRGRRIEVIDHGRKRLEALNRIRPGDKVDAVRAISEYAYRELIDKGKTDISIARDYSEGSGYSNSTADVFVVESQNGVVTAVKPAGVASRHADSFQEKGPFYYMMKAIVWR
jgi:hypothetical protein